MKNRRYICFILFMLIMTLFPYKVFSQNIKFDELQNAWDTLWTYSDINRHMYANNYGELFYTIDQRAYINDRKVQMKSWNKAVRKVRRNSYEEACAYFKDRLYHAVREGSDEQLLKEACLYVNLLHPDSLERRASVYADILLPIYSARSDLNELHYVYELMRHYQSEEPSSRYLSSVSSEAYSVYEETKSALTGPDYLKGMWVSKTFDKKSHKPMIIMNVREDAEHNIFGVLDQNSQYSIDNDIQNSTVSRIFGIDEDGDYLVQFCSMEFDRGLSESGVILASTLVNEATKSTVNAVARSSIGDIGSSSIGIGLSVLSAVAIVAIGNSSANTMTNNYLNVRLRETDDRDVMLADFDLEQHRRKSDSPTDADSLRKRDTFVLCKLLPEHGLFFTGKGLFPIVEPSRQAYVTPEYYRIYKGYDKYVRKYKTARSPAFWIFWYPLWPGMTALYVSTGSTPNNKAQEKKFNQIYSNR